MARRHELEIEIGPDGRVQVHVKGAKGADCLQYVQLFQTMGQVTDQSLTSEYYEPGSVTIVTDALKTTR